MLNYISCFQNQWEDSIFQTITKSRHNTSVKISIFCLISLVGISESCEAFALFRLIISFLASDFVTLLGEN